MLKRSFDILCATLGLLVAAPLLALAAIGIRLTSAGPVLYRARRAGLSGHPFTMFKLRTMRVGRGAGGSRVTAREDPRVFALGRLLRAAKIDELPQLFNVLRGDMSIIGPRPEDPDIVAAHYTSLHRETLMVPPGLSSPGSLYHDTHLEQFLSGPGYLYRDPNVEEFLSTDETEQVYLEQLLPLKLALDLVYVRRASLWYDLALVSRTIGIIVGKLTGRRTFQDPPELAAARQLVAPVRYKTAVAPPPILSSNAAREILSQPMLACGRNGR